MDTKVNVDKRHEIDKKYDAMFNKMVRDAALNARQRIVVGRYLRTIVGERIHEVENAMNMGFWIALIELEHFGCNKRATRLPRIQDRVIEIVGDAYERKCIDANGCILDYDGCGIERLKSRLKSLGLEVEYDG